MNYRKIDSNLEMPATGVPSSRKRVIERQGLSDELAGYLRDMITRGELQPGSRINTPRLCSRFGVSRTPLREALKILATEGLVQLMPNRSAVVQRVTDDVINELIPIVGALAALAGRIACARLDDRALAEFGSMHERLLHYLDQRDERSYMEVEGAFLAAVFAVAGNKTLTKFYETLTMKLQWQSACHHSMSEWKQTFEVHKQLLHALQLRDGELWALVLYRHVLHRAALLLRGTDAPASRMTNGVWSNL
ncbi:MAG TPA: GntR family transcriptional regulator [Steroidobacteraceae bacterium]